MMPLLTNVKSPVGLKRGDFINKVQVDRWGDLSLANEALPVSGLLDSMYPKGDLGLALKEQWMLSKGFKLSYQQFRRIVFSFIHSKKFDDLVGYAESLPVREESDREWAERNGEEQEQELDNEQEHGQEQEN